MTGNPGRDLVWTMHNNSGPIRRGEGVETLHLGSEEQDSPGNNMLRESCVKCDFDARGAQGLLLGGGIAIVCSLGRCRNDLDTPGSEIRIFAFGADLGGSTPKRARLERIQCPQSSQSVEMGWYKSRTKFGTAPVPSERPTCQRAFLRVSGSSY